MKETPTLRQLGALVSQHIGPKDIPQEAWPALISAALQHGLAPMLLWITKQGAPDIVTEPLWTRVITTTRNAGIQYVALEAARSHVGAALAAAQIPSLWIKGIVLAQTIYPQPVLRSMSDLDVLVPYEQRENALRIVEGLGYRFYETNGDLMSSQKALELNLTLHYHLRGGINDSVMLELHFRLLSTDNELLPLDKLEWFWTQTTTLQDGGQFTILHPEAHLLYLCAHVILQHGEEETSLRQYFDLHLLITNTLVDWDNIVEQAAVLGWRYAVERALSLAVRYFSTPVPAAVFAELQRSRPRHDPMTGRAVRIRGKGSRWEKVLISLQDMSFAKRIEYVGRILFPQKSYMRMRYDLRLDQPVWPAYLYRWFDQGREIGWAMWNHFTRAIKGGED